MSDQEVSRKGSDGWSAHVYPHESLPEHFQLLSLFTAHFNASKAEPFPESSRLPKDTEVRQSSTSPDHLGSCQSVGPQHRFSIDILLVYARLLRKALLTSMVISKQTAASKVTGSVPQTEGIQRCPEPRQPSAPAPPRFL